MYIFDAPFDLFKEKSFHILEGTINKLFGELKRSKMEETAENFEILSKSLVPYIQWGSAQAVQGQKKGSVKTVLWQNSGAAQASTKAAWTEYSCC
jgi:hypothetical protein